MFFGRGREREKRIVNGEMAELESVNEAKEKKLWKAVFAVSGIMITLVIYGLLQVSSLSLFYSSSQIFPWIRLYCWKSIEETCWVLFFCGIAIDISAIYVVLGASLV